MTFQVPGPITLGCIENPVVDSIFAVLPKLEERRHNSIAAPMVRPRHILALKRSTNHVNGILQRRPTLNGSTLL